MAKPMIEQSYVRPGRYVIRVGGKRNGRLWGPAGNPDGYYAEFDTRAKAEKFIQSGGLIEVTKIPLHQALAASGWDEAAGYSDENIARFKDWCRAEGVYFYARPREAFFPQAAVREAQARGLSKLVLEDLS